MEKLDVAISLKDLKMNYGSKEVLKGVNLDVYKGQIIGYIGPNGAGKSTTVKIMLGLVEGYDGEVEILGEKLTNNSYKYKKHIGYVPEIADIYDSLTPREYLTFIGELYGMDENIVENKIKKLLEIFNMQEAYNSRISSFSKGMKQKILIISSLIHNPDILFLDEPLSGLDANSVMVVKEILSSLAQNGKTIFYSSHIMDVVEKISNRIVLIANGQIQADGSFEELKQKSKEGSLEEIFNKITGFDEHKQLAERFVSIIQGDEN
ncbi:ABC transporter ATP-binding protein [Clostridium tarantellae]|uniref:ATP-binding cassette domain-containing protein n=1 Tax=Clostridium tarantellae TaxID=39493 RepID=A0A6I1MUG1_9CLOT|nr:ABC transporter ATP-binding protein [Clostridium tarantellae]MPQ43859.1 ATP-binding cassette domain-containing protein [Clostridium tarantellae]